MPLRHVYVCASPLPQLQRNTFVYLYSDPVILHRVLKLGDDAQRVFAHVPLPHHHVPN